MSTDTLTLGPSFWAPTKILNDVTYQAPTGAYQTSGRTGNRWLFTLTYENLISTRRKTMVAHDRQMQGRINRLKVNMDTKLGYTRTGPAGGSPLLVGIHSAGARALSIDGATTTATGWLTGADYITIGNELKAVTASCNTVAGATTISIWPELHQNYADNTVINVATPFGIFFQQQPAQYGSIVPYFTADNMLTSLTFFLEEDVVA